MSDTPPPAKRVGDAERDDAVVRLREHHAAGRLTFEEFQERCGAALQARTTEDLRELFVDLPSAESTGDRLPEARPASRPPVTFRDPVTLAVTIGIWAAIVAAIVGTRGAMWWLIFVAIGITGLIPEMLSDDEDDNDDD